jgi:hypothetical protein
MHQQHGMMMGSGGYPQMSNMQKTREPFQVMPGMHQIPHHHINNFALKPVILQYIHCRPPETPSLFLIFSSFIPHAFYSLVGRNKISPHIASLILHRLSFPIQIFLVVEKIMEA